MFDWRMVLFENVDDLQARFPSGAHREAHCIGAAAGGKAIAPSACIPAIAYFALRGFERLEELAGMSPACTEIRVA